MLQTSHLSSRRKFLQSGALALTGSWCAARARAAEPAAPRLFSAVGLNGSLARAAALKAQGVGFLTLGVGDFLVPDKSDGEFAGNLAKLAASPLPVLACNGFLRPAHLRCVGAEANHDMILDWAAIAFRRLKQANGKLIVFGSASSRDLRDGWTKDKADPQFVALLKRMGPLAAQHDITVVVEQLQVSECNYINHLGEGAALIRAAGHPNIRINADLFHMLRMGDTPADLKAAMDVVAHLEIAEKRSRTVPGVDGDDFRAFFHVLRQANYQGAISIEGSGNDEQLGNAIREISRQAAEA
jgi:sugar phosphate isomerase/epimerase